MELEAAHQRLKARQLSKELNTLMEGLYSLALGKPLVDKIQPWSGKSKRQRYKAAKRYNIGSQQDAIYQYIRMAQLIT